MDIIDSINKRYDGNIILFSPLVCEKPDFIPEELFSILKISNGIEETMIINGKAEPIAWIVYSYSEILEATKFYSDTYGVKGIVFASNGAGDPLIIKPDGRIIEFDAITNEEFFIAENLYAYLINNF